MRTRSCYFFLLFFFLSVISTRSQERAPHGLAYENPTSLSPSAYDFFHPDVHNASCDGCSPSAYNFFHPDADHHASCEGCSPFPLAAQVRASEAREPRMTMQHSGLGGVIGIMINVVLSVLLGVGVCYWYFLE